MEEKKADLFEHINAGLNQLDRQQAGRMPLPSALCIDTQSVKLAPMVCEFRGNDAHKRVNGRKRTFVVDTQGRLWVADVDAANRADGTLAVPLVAGILWRVGERLEKVFGDQAASAVRLQWGFRGQINPVEYRLRESVPARINAWFCAGS